MLNTQFGKFDFAEQIAAGGMGQVWRVTHQETGQEMAAKLVRWDLCTQPLVRSSFFDEQKAAKRLCHPSILSVDDFGELDNGQLWMLMQHLQGQTLADRLRHGPFTMQDALRIILRLCSALHHAHERRVIHRDVKPSNVFLCRDGRIVLLDFGIAKILRTDGGATQTGLVKGTPRYMAPEQYAGSAYRASDIYALAIMVHELVTGRRPWHADDALAECYLQGNEPPTLQIPQWEAVLVKALSKTPGDRHATAKDFAKELAAHTDGGWEILEDMAPELLVAVVLQSPRAGHLMLTLRDSSRDVTIQTPVPKDVMIDDITIETPMPHMPRSKLSPLVIGVLCLMVLCGTMAYAIGCHFR